MAEIHLEKYYEVEAARIWERIEDFFEIHTWLPIAESTERDEIRADVRRVTQVGGGTIVEQLVAQSARDRSIRYRIIGGDAPFRDFEGMIVVHEAAEPGRAIVTWDVTFRTDATEDEVVALLRTALEEGLEEMGKIKGGGHVQ
ncbi:SRPBCC family protein [Pseudonocardia xinjiangensis]|uniref:SRPBCC family protein n=1 Tax=Pseudonocardia xinjiangensis TaxID=75289 RepID=UPI003D8F610C